MVIITIKISHGKNGLKFKGNFKEENVSELELIIGSFINKEIQSMAKAITEFMNKADNNKGKTIIAHGENAEILNNIIERKGKK